MLIVMSAFASDCPQHYLDGTSPNAAVSRELCYSEFAVGYSDSKNHAIYAAEHITKAELLQADQLIRKNTFHEEPRLPSNHRATLADYRHSGYDRGHLAPNADMPTHKAQYESFSLANMVPQLHSNNAGVWSQIERAVRSSAMQYGDVYAVTGAIYGPTPAMLNHHIPVPVSMFKAIYIPATQQDTVYISDNDDSGTYRTAKVAELQALAGFNVFPSLVK